MMNDFDPTQNRVPTCLQYRPVRAMAMVGLKAEGVL